MAKQPPPSPVVNAASRAWIVRDTSERNVVRVPATFTATSIAKPLRDVQAQHEPQRGFRVGIWWEGECTKKFNDEPE
jgi:hypothetical protein